MNFSIPVRKTIAALFLFFMAARLDAAGLTVSAAASLQDALNEIKALYLAAHPGIGLNYNFGGSGALQQQIENGAPAGLFISAGAKQMDALEKKGLLEEGTRRDLLANSLVLIAPKESKALNSIADLTTPAVVHIAIGDPNSVPAGMYAKETFISLGIWKSVEPKIVRMLDARQVLTAVETANAQAGMVYLTDARSSNKVRIVTTAPEASHAPIVYPIAVIKGTTQIEAARAFAGFLVQEPARQVFLKFGFGIAK